MPSVRNSDSACSSAERLIRSLFPAKFLVPRSRRLVAVELQLGAFRRSSGIGGTAPGAARCFRSRFVSRRSLSLARRPPSRRRA